MINFININHFQGKKQPGESSDKLKNARSIFKKAKTDYESNSNQDNNLMDIIINITEAI